MTVTKSQGRAVSAPSSFVQTWARAGVTVAVVDALWAVALTLAYGRTITALWQGVASVPFGKSMLTGGIAAAWVGLGVHFCVAFFWSAVFVLLYRTVRALPSFTMDTAGLAIVSAVYGPLIWAVMSLVLIPLRTGNPAPPITARWIIQFCGHAVFVGLPIVWSVSRAPAHARQYG